MSSNYKQKIFLMLLVGVSSIAALIYSIVLPTLHDIDQLGSAISAQTNDLELRFERSRLLKQSLVDFKAIESDKTKIDAAFITQGDEITFVTDLEKTAALFGIDDPRFTKLSLTGKNNSQVIQELPLQITASGDYTRIIKYLHGIEGLPYYFTIEKITLNSTNETQGKVSATFDGKVYIKKQP